MTKAQALLLVGAALVSVCVALMLPPNAPAARIVSGPRAGSNTFDQTDNLDCDCAGPGGRFGGPGTRR
jgi:hypothetical protein